MKKKLIIAVNKTQVDRVEREVELPETAKYYSKNDDGNFFPRGLILFAIIPYREGSTHYTVLEIERNKQSYTDFVPTSDCKGEFFLSNNLRTTALALIEKSKFDDFVEITKEEFDTKRIGLINYYQQP